MGESTPSPSSLASTASGAQNFLGYFEVVPDFRDVVFEHFRMPLDPLRPSLIGAIERRWEVARFLLYCCWKGPACSVDDGEVEAMVRVLDLILGWFTIMIKKICMERARQRE